MRGVKKHFTHMLKSEARGVLMVGCVIWWLALGSILFSFRRVHMVVQDVGLTGWLNTDAEYQSVRHVAVLFRCQVVLSVVRYSKYWSY